MKSKTLTRTILTLTAQNPGYDLLSVAASARLAAVSSYMRLTTYTPVHRRRRLHLIEYTPTCSWEIPHVYLITKRGFSVRLSLIQLRSALLLYFNLLSRPRQASPSLLTLVEATLYGSNDAAMIRHRRQSRGQAAA